MMKVGTIRRLQVVPATCSAVLVVAVLALLVSGGGLGVPPVAAQTPSGASSPGALAAGAPLFVENVGQFDAPARFQSTYAGGTCYGGAPCSDAFVAKLQTGGGGMASSPARPGATRPAGAGRQRRVDTTSQPRRPNN